MSGLISGSTGFVSKVNLAANGNFRINQRGLTANLWVPVSVGLYAADCWRVDSSTIDFVEVSNELTGVQTTVRLRGFGRKNQSINIINRDISPWGGEGDNTDKSARTAKVRTFSTSSSVPARVAVSAPYQSTSVAYDYQADATVRPSEDKMAVSVVRGGTSAFNTSGSITIVLLEDGQFEYYLTDYAVLAGAFKHPPKFTPVPYADDLARCQRYYQKGSVVFQGIWTDQDTNVALIDLPVSFKATMAAAPTIALSAVYVTSYTGAGASVDASASAITSAIQISTEGFGLSVDFTDAANANRLKTFGGTLMYNWTAEVV